MVLGFKINYTRKKIVILRIKMVNNQWAWIWKGSDNMNFYFPLSNGIRRSSIKKNCFFEDSS